ncbi:ABC transporter permease [Thermohalobacter berrensis]|uniref:ABC transporter permease n=1 Tax=Thermohalobacter berrensis TaxID=99594 RepID=A0A419T832_9FIRM|nr:ABC transporter permease [Thermohalobacter berrensis]RKD33747.1 ABC transporter permease [Thermohalobacter berrensis]
MKKFINIENKTIPIAFLFLLIAIWQIIVDAGLVAKYILPSPKDVFFTFIDILPMIKGHVLVTLYEALLGFFISIVFALILSVLMDNISIVKKALYPLIVISQTVPIIALAPLFVIWFGFGRLPKIIVVVLVCFFPIVVSLLDGLESVDRDMLNLIRSMGGNKFQIFRFIKFPASMVSFFSGLRIAATYSIMGAVIGEWLGGSEGLGVYMLRVKHSYALDKMFAAILVIVILSMTLFRIVALVEYLVMPWTREMDK